MYIKIKNNFSYNEKIPATLLEKLLFERKKTAFIEFVNYKVMNQVHNHTGFLQVSVDQKVDLIAGEAHRV